MSRFAKFIPLAIGVAAALAPAAHAPAAHAQTPDKRTVTGRVVDQATGAPLAGAAVAIDASRRRVLADSLGRFVLRGVPDGRHDVYVELLGYVGDVYTFEVGQGSTHLTVPLRPNPVLLEGISVVGDRLKRRRDAAPVSVRVLDRNTLLAGYAFDAADLVRARAGLSRSDCSGDAGFTPISAAPSFFPSSGCVALRGQAITPSVAIDERPAFGLEELEMYRPEELYMIEVYGNGRHIRAYTLAFIEQTARAGLMPVPVF